MDSRFRRMPLCFALLLLAVLPFSSQAQVRLVGEEIPVNAGDAFQPRSPVAVFAPNGTFRVIWENDQLGIFLRAFDQEGRPVGPDELLIANDRLPQVPGVGPVVYRSEPAVLPLEGGGFFLFWTEEASIYHVGIFQEWREIQSRQIIGQRFNGAARPVGSPFRVSTEDGVLHTRPVAAFDPRGGLLVIWESDDGAPDVSEADGIFARHYTLGDINLGASPSAAPVRLNTTPGDTARRPALAVNGEGRFLAAWEGCCDAGGDAGVFARLIETNGIPAGTEFRVSTRTAGPQRRPAVSADPWSNFLVAWQGHVEDPDYPFASRIFGQLISRVGAFMGTEFQISDGAGTSQVGPALAPTPFGGYLVTWQDFNENFPVGTWAVELDSFGNLTRDELLLSTHQVGARVHISVATDGDGEFLVTWEGYPGKELTAVGQRLSCHEKSAGFAQEMLIPH